MSQSSHKPSRLVLLLSFSCLLFFCGCSEYWWTRGHPKSTTELLTSAQQKLELALSKADNSRPELVPLSKNISNSFLEALEASRKKANQNEIIARLSQVEMAMLELEGKLSVGSRAAYGELSAALRAVVNDAGDGKPPVNGAFTLLTARTLNFLSNELSVPAPVS